MARPPRYCPPDIPQHVTQRGNNRADCFLNTLDYAFFIHCLNEASLKSCVDIHAWVLMTNHFHLLATPHRESGLSLMMQDLGRRYVRYFNFVHERSGTLWEGRFKSRMVESSQYLFECYRYIELNPVRAGMVQDPEEYHWSSYASNALGKQSGLITYHPEYMKLGNNPEKRMLNYLEFLNLGSDQLNKSAGI